MHHVPQQISSFVHGFMYNDGDLLMQLNGRVYRYRGVPADRVTLLRQHESLGKGFNQYIKGQYEVEEVSDR